MAKMRDLRSFTGVNSTQNIFAVSDDGETVVFKKTSKELYFFHTELSHGQVLALVCSDEVHNEDTIFDLFFSQNILFIVLQSCVDESLAVAKCEFDFESASIIATHILPTPVHVRSKGGISRVIFDDHGPVIVSFPNAFTDRRQEHRTIELFHLGEFVHEGLDRIQRIPLKARNPKNDELWCDPFISRNALYFFNRSNHQLLTISALDVFQCRLVQTRPRSNGSLPSRHFMHRSCIVFEDFVFVYFSQFMDTGKIVVGESDCAAWKLHLNSLEWEPLELSLSHHIPKSKVTMRAAPSLGDHVFLHGSCNVPHCAEQFHLYELRFNDINPETNNGAVQYINVFTEIPLDERPPPPPPHRTPVTAVTSEYINVGAKEMFCKNKSASSSKTPKAVLRKSRRRSSCGSLSTATQDHRLSTHSSHSCLTSASASSSGSSGKSSVMSWSRQISLEPTLAATPHLSEQLKHAKDMGYTDHEIVAAVDYHNKHNKSKGHYQPFRSTEDMVDVLTLVQKLNASPAAADSRMSSSCYVTREHRCDEEEQEGDCSANDVAVSAPLSMSMRSQDSGVVSGSGGATADQDGVSLRFPTTWTSSVITPRSASVNRSASFTNAHSYSSLLRRPRSSYYLQSLGSSNSALNAVSKTSLQRLVDTFNNERRVLVEEFAKALADNKRKLELNAHERHDMECRMTSLMEENGKLKSQMRDRELLEQRFGTLETRNAELAGIVERKSAEIAELRATLDGLSDIVEEAEEARRTLSQKETELTEAMGRVSELQEHLDKLSAPDVAIAELQEEVLSLKAETREYREKQQVLACTTCMDQPRNTLYLPCLHYICCSGCAQASDHCSICRTRLMGKVQVYQ